MIDNRTFVQFLIEFHKIFVKCNILRKNNVPPKRTFFLNQEISIESAGHKFKFFIHNRFFRKIILNFCQWFFKIFSKLSRLLKLQNRRKSCQTGEESTAMYQQSRFSASFAANRSKCLGFGSQHPFVWNERRKRPARDHQQHNQ